MIKIKIDVRPVTWRAHGGYGKRSFNPRQLEKDYYQHIIKQSYQSNNPISLAVKVDYTFFLYIPVTVSKVQRKEILSGHIHHVKKIDVTNLVKFAEDTLKGIVIKDDCQVVEYTARKLYGETEGTIMEIRLA